MLVAWGAALKGTTLFPEMGMAQSPMERAYRGGVAAGGFGRLCGTVDG